MALGPLAGPRAALLGAASNSQRQVSSLDLEASVVGAGHCVARAPVLGARSISLCRISRPGLEAGAVGVVPCVARRPPVNLRSGLRRSNSSSSCDLGTVAQCGALQCGGVVT